MFRFTASIRRLVLVAFAAGTGLLALAAQDERKDPVRRKDQERKKDGEARRDAALREDGDIRGIVKSVDAAKGTITIQKGVEREVAERTYSLSGKDVKVTLLPTGQALKLSDVAPMTTVYLKLDDAEDVVAIRVQAPTLNEPLRSVDPAKRQITLAGDRGAELRALTLAPDARISLREQAAKLDDFKPGTRVNVVLSLDRKTVLALSAGPDREDAAPREGVRRDGDAKEGGAREGDPRPDAMGIVTGIDAARGVLEVLTGGDDNPVIRSVTVPKDFKIHFRPTSRDFALAELPKASKVAVYLGPDKKEAARIDLLAPLVRTTLQAIDAGKRTVTYGEKTLEVAPTARIVISRQQIALGELTPGMRVQLTLNPERTQIVGIQAYRADGER